MEKPLDMDAYFADLGLRLGRSTQAYGLKIEAPVIESGVATEVLALAASVAHTSERTFAPIASFAAGIAVGRLKAAGLLSTDLDVTKFLAQLRKELDPQ
jgi:hypothetical protein